LQDVGAFTFAVETTGDNAGMPCPQSGKAMIGNSHLVGSNDFLLCIPMI
jgi:hypothetical protein